MMAEEISKTYYFDSADYDNRGRRKTDGKTFRDVVKEFEFDFHDTYMTEYAQNLYSNSQTMDLLAKSNDAAPFLLYGMDLTQGNSFDPIKTHSSTMKWTSIARRFMCMALTPPL